MKGTPVKRTLAVTAVSAVTAGLAVLGTASPAAADPTDVYPAALNGSGSDTTELVMIALDAAIPALGNWSVSGAVPWDTNGPDAGCSFNTRFLGSGAGRTALANSVTLNDGCFQFARSSSRSTSATPGTVSGSTYTASGAAVPILPITLGTDGLTYVFRAGSSTPRDLTLGQLRAIYACNFAGTVDGRSMSAPTIPNKPLLPTDASGSRADWLALMGLPTSPAGSGVSEVSGDGGTLPACLDDGPGDTIAEGEFAEHNGNVLTGARQIILHSIPQYIAQGRAGLGDARGLSVLGYINGNVPIQLYDNPAGTLSNSTASGSTIVDGALFRPVYNIIPASKFDDPAYTAVFGTRIGGNSAGGSDLADANSGAICTSDAIILSNGFAPAC